MKKILLIIPAILLLTGCLQTVTPEPSPIAATPPDNAQSTNKDDSSSDNANMTDDTFKPDEIENKLQEISVTDPSDKKQKHMLSRPVTLPLNLEDAEFINTETDCCVASDQEARKPVLEDDNWILGCCTQYPSCSAIINQYTGETYCELFG